MICGLCEIRLAVYHTLCESCAEGITRLVNIELPEYLLYPVGMKIRCHHCQLMCQSAEHYVNHTCEPTLSRPQLHVRTKNKKLTR